jgi:hypothetical protein
VACKEAMENFDSVWKTNNSDWKLVEIPVLFLEIIKSAKITIDVNDNSS